MIGLEASCVPFALPFLCQWLPGVIMFKRLSGGQFYGELIRSEIIAGLTLSETRYPAGACLPRHCHEHAYFCLIRQGTYREEYGGRQRARSPRMLAFHPPEEVHAEHFDGEEVRSFNIEFTPSWLRGGNSLSSKEANFNGDNPYGDAAKGPFLGRPTTVGSYAPNAWGLYDMHGNVFQWCKDGFDAKYQFTGKKGATDRVARGGWFVFAAKDCRAASRFHFPPESRTSATRGAPPIGFRVVVRQREQ